MNEPCESVALQACSAMLEYANALGAEDFDEISADAIRRLDRLFARMLDLARCARGAKSTFEADLGERG